MAKATAKCVCEECGKTFYRVKICRNRRDADNFEAWASENCTMCDECYKKAMQAKREEEAAQNVERAKDNKFGIDIDALDLGGSEKQNAWAKKILAEYMGKELAVLGIVVHVMQFAVYDITADAAEQNKLFEAIGFDTTATGEEALKENQKIMYALFAEAIRDLTAREIIDGRDQMKYVIRDKVAAKIKAKLTPPAPEAPATPAPEAAKEEAPAKVKAPKTEWRKIAINAQNIIRETESGLLIAVPHKSKYDGYNFWVSKKLMREGSHSFEYHLSINADMKFNLFKNGNGKYNKFKRIAETEISADELAEAFNGYVEGAPEHERKVDEDREEIIKHEPAHLEPVENVEIDPELMRNA